MKLVILALFTASAWGTAASVDSVSAMAISPGMDTEAISSLAKRSTERELERLTARMESGGPTEREDAAAQSDEVVHKVRQVLSTRKNPQSPEIKALLKKNLSALSRGERHDLIHLYLTQRTQQTTDLLTKLAYANEEVRDWLTRAKASDLDNAIDIFQNPQSPQYQKLMKRIAQQNASVARSIRKQVGQAHMMSRPVMAGMTSLPSDREVAEAKKRAASSEAPAK